MDAATESVITCICASLPNAASPVKSAPTTSWSPVRAARSSSHPDPYDARLASGIKCYHKMYKCPLVEVSATQCSADCRHRAEIKACTRVQTSKHAPAPKSHVVARSAQRRLSNSVRALLTNPAASAQASVAGMAATPA